MRKFLIGILSALLISCFTSQAYALVIDFEDLQTRNNFNSMGIQNTYQGFQWYPAESNGTGWASATINDRVSGETVPPVSGTAYGWNWNGPQSLFINFGSPTNVASAWFTTLGPSYGSNSSTIQMFGYDVSNQMIASSSILNLTDSFQQLMANFNNVYRLEIRADRNSSWFIVDDINLASGEIPPTIPEPATMFLLGSGLIGALGFRKKQN